jgi:CobQ-like glutamine amidotransferase family enzyme
MKLIIGYLYGDLMNIYGDTGNVVCLQKRCQWRGIECEIKQISIGDKIKKGSADIYFFGGGQDQSQIEVSEDLGKSDKSKSLKSEIERGAPLLAICGGYQLLGEYYAPFEGPKLEGVEIFPAYTEASHDRMIGNIVIETPTVYSLQSTAKQLDSKMAVVGSRSSVDLLVGFENHSGKTYLKEGAEPLGKVIKGFGNNGEDKTEGCVYKNAIGCYMHGSLLPKNPDLADWLIKKALEVKYGKEINLEPINDDLESQAHSQAIQLFG